MSELMNDLNIEKAMQKVCITEKAVHRKGYASPKRLCITEKAMAAFYTLD